MLLQQKLFCLAVENVKGWLRLNDGEILTDAEAAVQVTIGVFQMAVGKAGMLGLGGLGGVIPGAFLMADGAFVLSKGLQNTKATPVTTVMTELITPASYTLIDSLENRCFFWRTNGSYPYIFFSFFWCIFFICVSIGNILINWG